MTVASYGPRSAARQILGVRNFRLLCVGQAVSLFGEQISVVALTWLALQVMGDSLALGSVLAVAGLPPAILVLVSGVLTDRFTPRAALLLAEALRLVVVCALVLLILRGSVGPPALYCSALVLGLLTALAMPAAGSIVPSLAPRSLLQPANSLYSGLAQLAAFVGPAGHRPRYSAA